MFCPEIKADHDNRELSPTTSSPHPEINQEPLNHARDDRSPDLPTYQPTLGCLRDHFDVLPESPPTLLNPTTDNPTPRVRRIILRVRPDPVPYTTPPDSFGQYRIYPSKPRTIPDSGCDLEDLCDIPKPLESAACPASSPLSTIIAPCPNVSAFRLQYWHWNKGSKKTQSTRESLVHDVISQADFVPLDVTNVNWCRLDDSLASFSMDIASSYESTTVLLAIPPRTPAAVTHYKSNPGMNIFSVPATQCQTLVGAIRLAFAKNNHRFFHYEPYEAHYCDPKTSKSYRVFGEAYESQRMLEAHQEVQNIPLDKPCELPRSIAALMFFSDATQLTLFGKAKAWPIRVTFGNLSKYERCKPNSENHYELAFIPSVSHQIYQIASCRTHVFTTSVAR